MDDDEGLYRLTTTGITITEHQLSYSKANDDDDDNYKRQLLQATTTTNQSTKFPPPPSSSATTTDSCYTPHADTDIFLRTAAAVVWMLAHAIELLLFVDELRMLYAVEDVNDDDDGNLQAGRCDRCDASVASSVCGMVGQQAI